MSVTLILGPMFAGKTTAMHSHIGKAILSGRKVQVIVPQIDTRYTRKAMSTSHDGMGLQALKTNKLSDVQIESGFVIGIEEGHFFSDLAEFLVKQSNAGNDVFVAALHATSDRTAWPSISASIAIADHIEMKKAICVSCGKEASCSKKIENANGRPTIDVGGAEKYVAACNVCFYKNLSTETLSRFRAAVEVLKSKKEII